MLSVAKVFVFAVLTVTIAQDASSGITAHPTSSPTPCAPTFTVGHVPGHFNRVWEIRCVTSTEDMAHNATKGT